MKAITCLFTLLTLVYFSSRTFAGDKVGNGGGFWGCYDSQKTLLHGQFVDLYEAQEEYGLSLIADSGAFQAIVNERAQFLATQLPEFSQALAPYLTEVKNKIHFVDAELKQVDDSLYHISPLPKYCGGLPWQYVQFANFTDQGQVLIRQDLWQSPLISELDKAALIWHEAVYRWLRVEKGDTNSVRARQIVGILFSRLSSDEMRTRLSNVLTGSTPPASSWVCLSRNMASNKVYLGASAARREAELSAIQQCQEQFSGACLENQLECDQIESSTSKYLCEVKNLSTGKTYSSRGRSKVEGKFQVLNTCAQGDLSFGQCNSASVTCQGL